MAKGFGALPYTSPAVAVDPASIARSMMSAEESQGKRMFSSEEFPTASQVAGFFSRLAVKKSLFNEYDLEEEKLCYFPLPAEQ